MALETFLLYLATWTLVALSPGPAVMFVMSQGARYGTRGALAGASGICAGHLVCFTAVAFGLAALLASASGVLTGIRIVGALYLMYLGVKMILSKLRGAGVNAPGAGLAAATAADLRGISLQGLLVQLTNPKNLLFVLALLPQFVSAERALLPQLGIMLVVTVVIDALMLMIYAQIAMRGVRALEASRVILWLERAFGGALIVFGLKLLLDRK